MSHEISITTGRTLMQFYSPQSVSWLQCNFEARATIERCIITDGDGHLPEVNNHFRIESCSAWQRNFKKGGSSNRVVLGAAKWREKQTKFKRSRVRPRSGQTLKKILELQNNYKIRQQCFYLGTLRKFFNTHHVPILRLFLQKLLSKTLFFRKIGNVPSTYMRNLFKVSSIRT